MRFFTSWPAFMMEVFRYMDDAITLKPVTDPIFDYGKSTFEKANSTLTHETMKNIGVQDESLIKSYGLFAIVLAGIFILLGIYFLVKCCARSRNKVI